MRFRAQRSVRVLKKCRRSLLASYDAEVLHRLRVTLRQIRAALMPIPTNRARTLRRDFGWLAQGTNKARDWDTLLLFATRQLTAEQYNELRSLLWRGQAAARDDVYSTLRDRRWKSAIRRWKKYARKIESIPDDTTVSQEYLLKIVRRSNKAVSRAMARNDEKHWHRLRICVKELRYTLERLPGNRAGPGQQSLLALCRRLQAELGDWHDSVVHRQLLDTLSVGDPNSRALYALNAELTLHGKRCLECVRARLESRGSGNTFTLTGLT